MKCGVLRPHLSRPCNTLQHTATHCNTLQHVKNTATRSNTLDLLTCRVESFKHIGGVALHKMYFVLPWTHRNVTAHQNTFSKVSSPLKSRSSIISELTVAKRVRIIPTNCALEHILKNQLTIECALIYIGVESYTYRATHIVLNSRCQIRVWDGYD